MPDVPHYYEYMNPVLGALRALGGSATNQELFEKVAEDMTLSEEQLAVIHNPERGNQPEAAYRMAWTRTYLKKAGYVENSSRGVWSLTAKGRSVETVDPQQVVHEVRGLYAAERPEQQDTATSLAEPTTEDHDLEEQAQAWREQLLDVLRQMSPDAFERLCQRVLRECGFVEVNVLGRTGDGGIDGTGILRMQHIVSFQVFFQCKRWQGTVGSREIRDFRGAMVGRTDKGLFITTGRFSRDAQKEASRDGCANIDLIDGDQLIDLLKELGLGVRTETVEVVSVDENWFESI